MELDFIKKLVEYAESMEHTESDDSVEELKKTNEELEKILDKLTGNRSVTISEKEFREKFSEIMSKKIHDKPRLFLITDEIIGVFVEFSVAIFKNKESEE